MKGGREVKFERNSEGVECIGRARVSDERRDRTDGVKYGDWECIHT